MILLLFIQFCAVLNAQDPVIHNTFNRESFSLNGRWHYIVDPYEAGSYNFACQAFDEMDQAHKDAFFVDYKVRDLRDKIEHDFDKMPTSVVPGDWNSQDDKLFYYEGAPWYKKSFDYPSCP